MLEGEMDAAAVWPPFEFDLKCEKCGYNLRGLTPPGRCPECGRDLLRSYAAWYRRTQRDPPPDAQWTRQMRKAAWISLTAFGLMLLILVLPREMFGSSYRNLPFTATPGRVMLLSLTCVWWTLAWAGAWRLATAEQIPRRLLRTALVPIAVRWLCTGYLFLPAAWAWGTWTSTHVRHPAMYVYIALMVGGLAGGFALFARVGQVLHRGGSTAAAVCAWVFAVAAPLIMLLPLTAHHRDPSSLGLMLGLPVHVFGAAEIHFEVLHAVLNWRNLDEWFVWVFLLTPLIAVALFAWILVVFRSSRFSDVQTPS